MSAGPEAPRESGAPTLPGLLPLSCPSPRGYPASGAPGSLRARGAGGRGMPGSRGAVRVSAGPRSFGERRGGSRSSKSRGRLLPVVERGRGVRYRPEGAGGAGLSPATAEGRGHTHLGSPGSPPPAGSTGLEGGRRVGARWAWTAKPLVGARLNGSVGGSGYRAGSALAPRF